LSDHAKFKGGVKGIFHTDELPGYSITQTEVDSLRSYITAAGDDAVIIVADEAEKSRRALTAVVERAIELFNGVPLETRAANTDGTTRFTRPRPGSARMYPETDVKVIAITREYLEKIKENQPEMPEAKLKRFQSDYKLNEKLAKQVVDSEYIGLFEELTNDYNKLTTLAAVTLTEDLKKLHRDGVPVEKLTDDAIKNIFKLVDSGETVKESVPTVLAWLANNPGKKAKEALSVLGLDLLSEEELAAVVEAKIETNAELIQKMGEKAAGLIMGMVMTDIRGKAEAKDVHRMIACKLKKVLG
jgi:glutamyl-tRNA(Gln) amidotransferase subunit E